MNNHQKIAEEYFLGDLENRIKIHRCRMNRESYQLELEAGRNIDYNGYFLPLYSNFVLAYYLPSSPYYHDAQMLRYAKEALLKFEPYLHEDGSIDFYETNFHDPAQTGFYISWFLAMPTALFLRFSEHTEAEEDVFTKHQEILLRMGNAAATLGFHTPNHRWVICAALAVADAALGEPRFRPTIDRFLEEGIDCDEYGEYTERSTGSYNMVCNRAFLYLAYFLQDQKFLDAPRRNLKLMKHFLEPDLSVNTLNSTRWDQGGQYNINPYYIPYLMMSLIDQDPEFAYMADTIRERWPNEMLYCYAEIDVLTFFLLFPEMKEKQNTIPSEPLPKDRSIFLPNSKYARIYRPECNMTMTLICSRHPVFWQMNIGSSIVQARFAGSFFGDPHSQFRAQQIIPTEDGYRLICEENAGYRSQLDEKPETSEWRRMDHSKRHIINVQTFHTEITVHLLENGASFDIETSGCTRIPTKFELVVDPNGKLDSETFATIPKAGDYIFLKKGSVRYFIPGAKYLEIEGCYGSHTYAENMRGTFAPNPKKVTLAMTDITPHTSHVEIRVKDVFTLDE